MEINATINSTKTTNVKSIGTRPRGVSLLTNINHQFFIALQSVAPSQRVWAAKRVLELSYLEHSQDLEGAALLSSPASYLEQQARGAITTRPRRWFTRLQWHSEVRRKVISELISKSKSFIPSKYGTVRLQLSEETRWITRNASLDPITQELKFYLKEKQEGSILLCSLEQVDIVQKDVILKLGTTSTITMRCDTVDEAKSWVDVLQQYIFGTKITPIVKRVCNACGNSVSVSKALIQGGGGGTLITVQQGAVFFCSSQCVIFFEKTVEKGYKIELVCTKNGATTTKLVPISSNGIKSGDAPTPTETTSINNPLLNYSVLNHDTTTQEKKDNDKNENEDEEDRMTDAIDYTSTKTFVNLLQPQQAATSSSTTTTTTTTTTTAISDKTLKSVHFGNLIVYQHERIPGGSSGVPTLGIPLGIGWKLIETTKTTVDEYEKLRNGTDEAATSKTNQTDQTNQIISEMNRDSSSDEDVPFQFHRDGRTPDYERLEILLQHGHTKEEMKVLDMELKTIKKLRMATARSRTGKYSKRSSEQM